MHEQSDRHQQLTLIAERLRGGDRTALADLYRALRGHVLSVAVRELRSGDEAEDVVQWVFIKAWEARSDLRDPSKVRAWLGRIAANRARNVGANRTRTRCAGLGPNHGAVVPPVERDMEIAEERRRLHGAIERLSRRQQDVITLRVSEGLTFREIGSRLGCSDVSARVNYLYGVRNLRERLAA